MIFFLTGNIPLALSGNNVLSLGQVAPEIGLQLGLVCLRDSQGNRIGNLVSQSGSIEDAKTALQGAAQDLRAQAEAFRSSNSSIANEFWRGFEDGYDGD